MNCVMLGQTSVMLGQTSVMLGQTSVNELCNVGTNVGCVKQFILNIDHYNSNVRTLLSVHFLPGGQ